MHMRNDRYKHTICTHLWLHELARARAGRAKFRAETVVFAAEYRHSSIAALADIDQPFLRVDRNAHRQIELPVVGAVALAQAHEVDARVLLVDLHTRTTLQMGDSTHFSTVLTVLLCLT
jgi:hypothetical protein